MIQLNTLHPHPDNPRTITAGALLKLKKSIKDFAKMMEARPIVYDETNTILGGNQRYKALIALGYKEVPESWVRQVLDWSAAEKKEFLIKDNVSAGDWDWEVLSDWDTDSLGDWGMPDNKRRKGKIKAEALESEGDDLIENIKLKDSGVGLMKQHALRYFAAYRTQKGVDIKGIKRQIEPHRLLRSTVDFMRDFFGKLKDVAIVTTPARNSDAAGVAHFATECCKYLAQETGCNFYEGIFVNSKNQKGTTSRQKFAPKFEVVGKRWDSIKEPIIFMFDDVLTTGHTLLGLKPLLEGRNVFYFILMNNN